MKIGMTVGLVLLSTAAAFAQGGSSADERAIRELDRSWSQAAQNKDLDKMVADYTDDASVLPYNEPIVTGKKAIRELWQHMFSLPNTTVSFGPNKIEVSKSGDMAYDIGWAQIASKDAQGKDTVEKGKYVVVWKKLNGKWKVAADIFNTDK
jgi:uncharacterized protein (TIGR02246 family)